MSKSHPGSRNIYGEVITETRWCQTRPRNSGIAQGSDPFANLVTGEHGGMATNEQEHNAGWWTRRKTIIMQKPAAAQQRNSCYLSKGPVLL